jgi:hypothetical protein
VSVPDPQPQSQNEVPTGVPSAPPWRRWLFVLICLGLVIIRLIKPDVAVDGTTLWLLGIAALAFTLPEVVKFLAEFRRFEVGSVKFERYEREIQQIKQETEHEIQRIKQETEHVIERIRQETSHEVDQIKQGAEREIENSKATQPPSRKPKNRLLRAISELRGKNTGH